MRFSPKRTQSLAVIVACAVSLSAAIVLVVGYNIHRHVAMDSARHLLKKADDLAWNNQWIAAEPLYRQAEQILANQGNSSKALYARISQVPPHVEAGSLPSEIFELTKTLRLPAAQDPDTRLRILEIRGMIESNYDAGMALKTWSEVETLARAKFRYLLATRALGEEGIAAFILGDTTTAKKDVRAAWIVAKIARDYAAHVRYASVYGAGLVELRRYKEALTALDEAINTEEAHAEVGYPSIAINSKIDALRGLQRYTEAVALANEALTRVPNPSLRGHYHQLYLSRASVYENLNQWDKATADLTQALSYATGLEYWRGITEVGGHLAQAYEHQGDLRKALATVNQAIDANRRIPDELYFVPRNLAIKAEIVAKMGNAQEAEDLYKKSTAIIDSLLQHVPTRNVERMLISELGDVYSGYFESACNAHNYDKALRVLEEARGRVEAQALEHHNYEAPHDPTPEERRLTELNLELINSDDPAKRSELAKSIYDAELNADQRSLESLAISEPVQLHSLQADLNDDELLIEYVLAEPHSYALAITRTSVRPYELAGKEHIEADAQSFRNNIRKPQPDVGGGEALFNELLRPIAEYQAKSRIIVVPDGELHLLPFNALRYNGKFVVEDHTVTSNPSATVFAILRGRENVASAHPLPYVLGMRAQRVVFHYGIELEGLKYNSFELGELRRGMGTTFKAELTFDPSDLGHINVLDQRKGNYIQVPALNQAYATRLSLWQHKVIRRYALERLNARTDTLALAQAKAEIRAFIDRDFHRKSTRGRKRHARFLSEPSPQLSTTETLENPGIRLVPPKDVSVVGTTPNAIAPSFFQDDETLPVYEAGFDLPHPPPVIASAERVAFAAEEA